MWPQWFPICTSSLQNGTYQPGKVLPSQGTIVIVENLTLDQQCFWANILINLGNVKMKTGKTSFKMESISLEGRALTYVPLVTTYFTYPNMKKFTLLTRQEEGIFSPCPAIAQPIWNQCNSANTKLPWPWNLILLQLTFIPYCLSKLPSFSIQKKKKSSLHLPMASHSFYVPNCNSPAIPE